MATLRSARHPSFRSSSLSGMLLPYHLQSLRFHWLEGFLGIVLFITTLNGLHLLSISVLDSTRGLPALLSFSFAGFVSVATVIAFRWRYVSSVLEALGLRRIDALSLRRSAGYYALVAIGVGVLYARLLEIFGHQPALCMGNELSFVQHSSTFFDLPLWQVVLVSCVAPFWEEIIFRGIIYKDLRRRFGILTGVMCSSLVFAFLHPTLAIIPIFVLGLTTALSFEKAKSLWAPILVHGTYNLVVLWVQH